MVKFVKNLLLLSSFGLVIGTAGAMDRPHIHIPAKVVAEFRQSHQHGAVQVQPAEHQQPQMKLSKNASGVLAKIKKILKWSGIVIASGCLLDWLVLDPVIPPVITVPVMVGGGVCYLVLYHC